MGAATNEPTKKVHVTKPLNFLAIARQITGSLIVQVREQRRGQLRCTVQCHAYFPNVRRHLLDDAGLAQGGRRRGGRAVDGQAASGSHCHRCAGAQRHNRECAEDERAADGDSRLHRDDDYVCVCGAFGKFLLLLLEMAERK